MEEIRRWTPMVAIIGTTLLLHLYLAKALQRWANRHVLIVVFSLASLWILTVPTLAITHYSDDFPSLWVQLAQAVSLFWAIGMVAVSLWVAAASVPAFNSSRRALLLTAPVAAVPLLPIALGAAITRKRITVQNVDIHIPGLPKDLDGLRIAQLSDIHYGPFFGAQELEHAVAAANECKPHVTVLTGDLITRYGDDLDGCLRRVKGLKAEAALLGCHGNHEQYADAEDYCTAEAAKFGLRFLRRESEALRFGNARLNFVGYDYQRFGIGPPLQEAEELVLPDAFNILLSHNPGMFEVAAQKGYPLTLSGHTHGGQINLEIAKSNLNVARVFTPYVKGLYRFENSQIYVSAGLGTVALPVRLGAPPEVSLIRLCAS